MHRKLSKIFWVLSQGWLKPEGGVVLGLVDDDIILSGILWLYGYWEICNVYIMTHMFNIWFIYLSYDSYDLYDFYEFSVSLCIHTRHPDDWLGTAKNVLAVRLVYRHVHIWSYRSHVTTQFWLWLDWETLLYYYYYLDIKL
jgi:hypothetical protein